MHPGMILTVILALPLLAATPARAADQAPAADPLAPWRSGVVVRPVSTVADRHTIHPYFVTSPESPDGHSVVFYASTTPEAYEGEICVLDRSTGRERVVARKVTVEDAHRAACQQWASNGRRVVFHDVRDKQWLVAAVDLDTGRERILARDHQIGWGRPTSDWVPLYGCHWNPGKYRDLEMVNAETGELRTVVTAAAVRQTYQDSITKWLGDREISVFFPIISPNEKRIFFKLATPGGGDYRSRNASVRLGFVCYDLENARFLMIQGKWGHPAWHPDSRTVIQPGGVLIDTNDGQTRRIPGLPSFHGSHPSVSPDGRLFVTDTIMDSLGGQKGEWGIAVARMDGNQYVIVHHFDHTKGAKSWRRNDPHPSFSPDGKRIYFNVGDTPWTRLFVAEVGAK